MEKSLYILPVFLFLLVSCDSETENDKEVYQEVKKPYINSLDEYEDNTNSNSIKIEKELE